MIAAEIKKREGGKAGLSYRFLQKRERKPKRRGESHGGYLDYPTEAVHWPTEKEGNREIPSTRLAGAGREGIAASTLLQPTCRR